MNLYDGPMIDDVGVLTNPPWGSENGLYPEYIAVSLSEMNTKDSRFELD